MKHTYIHETHTIWGQDGEVHIENDNDTIVFNARNLLHDLDSMLYFAIKEVNKENKDKYEKYLFENVHYHSLDDYLFENEDLWVEQLEDATDRAEVEFGFGCDGIFNEDDSEVELRYDCEELKLGGHL